MGFDDVTEGALLFRTNNAAVHGGLSAYWTFALCRASRADELTARGSAKPAQITTKQFYWPETNVPITRFLSREGVGEIEDFVSVNNQFGPIETNALLPANLAMENLTVPQSADQSGENDASARSLSDTAVRDEAKEMRRDARPQARKNRKRIR